MTPHHRRISPRRSRCRINFGDCDGAPPGGQALLAGYSRVWTTSSKAIPLHDDDLLRYRRINPESVPVPNGGGSGGGASRKPAEPAPSPTPSKDERAPAVAADTSSLASYLARTSLEQHKPRGRPASSSAALVSHQLYNAAAHTSQSQGPKLGGGLYTLAAQASQGPTTLGGGLYTFAAQASQGPDIGGGSSSGIAIAAPDDPAPLRWGRKKRPRARRDPHAHAPAPTPAPAPAPTPAPAPAPTPAPAPEPELTPAQAARRRATFKIKNRQAAQAQAEAEKLMPPPSARGPIIRDTSPLPPRAATLSPLPSRAATLSQHRSSAEDSHAAAGEQQQPAAKWEPKPQRQASDKAPHSGSGEQQPAPKVEPKQPQRPQRHASSDKAPHTAGSGEPEPALKEEPRQAQRQQPQRQASMRASDKEKGKAPMVPESPAVPPHIAAKAAVAGAAAAEAIARPALPRIVTQLTRKEKEEDWFAMTGTKLPHRPHRRPKAVERDLHNMFPGQGLWEVNRTRYMVREKKSKKRQGGGLQAMAEEDDSD